MLAPIPLKGVPIKNRKKLLYYWSSQDSWVISIKNSYFPILNMQLNPCTIRALIAFLDNKQKQQLSNHLRCNTLIHTDQTATHRAVILCRLRNFVAGFHYRRPRHAVPIRRLFATCTFLCPVMLKMKMKSAIMSSHHH